MLSIAMQVLLDFDHFPYIYLVVGKRNTPPPEAGSEWLCNEYLNQCNLLLHEFGSHVVLLGWSGTWIRSAGTVNHLNILTCINTPGVGK
jgi:hypothetical protein